MCMLNTGEGILWGPWSLLSSPLSLLPLLSLLSMLPFPCFSCTFTLISFLSSLLTFSTSVPCYPLSCSDCHDLLTGSKGHSSNPVAQLPNYPERGLIISCIFIFTINSINSPSTSWFDIFIPGRWMHMGFMNLLCKVAVYFGEDAFDFLQMF